MKIGVIGSGRFCSSVHLPLLSCIPDVSIEFIADRKNPETLAKTYNTKSIQLEKISSLPDCDIILLVIPVGAKTEYLYELAKLDCFIFSEKPFAINLETHENLLALSDKFTCNYVRNFYNTTRNIKNIISSGVFGKIQKISIIEGGIHGKTGINKNSYRNDPKLSGGFLNESASHTFSQLDFLFDNISVSESDILWEDDFDLEYNVTFDVRDDNLFKIDYMGTQIKRIQPNTTVFFEQTKIQFNHLIPDSIFTISPLHSDDKFILQQENSFASTFPQAYYLKWKDFLNKVSSSKLDVKYETSLITTKIISDIIQKGSKR